MNLVISACATWLTAWALKCNDSGEAVLPRIRARFERICRQRRTRGVHEDLLSLDVVRRICHSRHYWRRTWNTISMPDRRMDQPVHCKRPVSPVSGGALWRSGLARDRAPYLTTLLSLKLAPLRRGASR